jgi:hypothetical protein
MEVHDLFIGRLIWKFVIYLLEFKMEVRGLFIGRLRWKFVIYLLDV